MEEKDKSKTPELPPLPWHIYVDPSDKNDQSKRGRIVHINEPQYECRFYIGNEIIEAEGLCIHNVTTGVQLYDLLLPDEKEPKPDFLAINRSMKEAARFVYDILYLPYFR